MDAETSLLVTLVKQVVDSQLLIAIAQQKCLQKRSARDLWAATDAAEDRPQALSETEITSQ